MCSIRASRAVLAAIGLAAALSSRSAAAQPVSKDAAMAETLFEEAKKRMESGDYVGACPKLAESYRLDPGSGTLTALALCHEQLGRTATAWAEFIEVVTEAQQAGRADREKFARKHVTALEPHLSRLTISVAPETARLPDVQVRRDRVVVGSAAWGVSSPVDPGEHLVEASAPGHLAWSTRVRIARDGDEQSVAVPALDEKTDSDSNQSATASATSDSDAPPMVQPATETKDTPPEATGGTGNGQRAAGWVLGGLGLASMVTGGVFGVQALSKASDANNQCPTKSGCSSTVVNENHTAKTDALVSDVTIGTGIVAIGVGVYLLISAPSGKPSAPPASDTETTSRLRFTPTVGPRVAGIALQGSW
jgi:hypothetical protein